MMRKLVAGAAVAILLASFPDVTVGQASADARTDARVTSVKDVSVEYGDGPVTQDEPNQRVRISFPAESGDRVRLLTNRDDGATRSCEQVTLSDDAGVLARDRSHFWLLEHGGVHVFEFDPCDGATEPVTCSSPGCASRHVDASGATPVPCCGFEQDSSKAARTAIRPAGLPRGPHRMRAARATYPTGVRPTCAPTAARKSRSAATLDQQPRELRGPTSTRPPRRPRLWRETTTSSMRLRRAGDAASTARTGAPARPLGGADGSVVADAGFPDLWRIPNRRLPPRRGGVRPGQHDSVARDPQRAQHRVSQRRRDPDVLRSDQEGTAGAGDRGPGQADPVRPARDGGRASERLDGPDRLIVASELRFLRPGWLPHDRRLCRRR